MFLRLILLYAGVYLVLLPVATAQDAPKGQRYVDRGQRYLEQENFQAALADFERALRVNDELVEAIGLRAQAKAGQGDHAGAIEDYNTIIGHQPDDPWHFARRADSKHKLALNDEALSDVTRALEIDSENLYANILRGRIHFAAKRFAESVADFDRLIVDYPSSPPLHIERGIARHKAGDIPGALSDFTTAIELDETDPAALRLRATLRYDRRDWAESLRDFRRADAMGGDAESIDYAALRIFLIQTRLGDGDRAGVDLQRHLKRRSETSDLWWLTLCHFLLKQRTESDLLAEADSADEPRRRQMRCEAFFYAGAVRELGDEIEAASTLYVRCIATGVDDFSEYDSAIAALEHLRNEERGTENGDGE